MAPKVSIYNDNLVKVAENYLRKGSKVYIEGALQTRKFQDQSGAERTITEIVLQKFRGELTMLDGKGDGGGAGASREDGDFGGYSSGPRNQSTARRKPSPPTSTTRSRSRLPYAQARGAGRERLTPAHQTASWKRRRINASAVSMAHSAGR